MINVTIGKNFYEAPSKWSEIKLHEAVELHELCKNEIPKELESKYDIILNSRDLDRDIEDWANDLDETEVVKSFPKFYGKIIQFFTDAPDEVMDYTTIESRTNIFTLYFEKFVLGILHNGIGYNPLGITSFKHHSDTYYLPSEYRTKDLLIPCNDITTAQFCESADLISYINKQERGFKFTAYVVSILCLKDKEKYSESLLDKRVQEFQDLPMDIVWEVFFCLHDSIVTLNKGLQTSFQKRVLREIETKEVYQRVGVDSSLTYTLSQIIPFSWN